MAQQSGYRNGATTGPSGSSNVVNFPASTRKGDFLLVVISVNQNITTYENDQGQFTKMGTYSPTTNHRGVVFYRFTDVDGAQSYNFTGYSGATPVSTSPTIMSAHYSGVDSTNPFDGGPVTSNTTTVPTLTTSTAGQVLVTAHGVVWNNTGTAYDVNPASGMTKRLGQSGSVTGTLLADQFITNAGDAGSRTVSGTGTILSIWSVGFALRRSNQQPVRQRGISTAASTSSGVTTTDNDLIGAGGSGPTASYSHLVPGDVMVLALSVNNGTSTSQASGTIMNSAPAPWRKVVSSGPSTNNGLVTEIWVGTWTGPGSLAGTWVTGSTANTRRIFAQFSGAKQEAGTQWSGAAAVTTQYTTAGTTLPSVAGVSGGAQIAWVAVQEQAGAGYTGQPDPTVFAVTFSEGTFTSGDSGSAGVTFSNRASGITTTGPTSTHPVNFYSGNVAQTNPAHIYSLNTVALAPDNQPPNTPVLTAPANASTQPLAGGYTFTWNYSDPDNDAQAAIAFRRKISGAASYEYWNPSTGAWQATEFYFALTTPSLTFDADKWNNGSIYQWSVATRDTQSNTGPFASDFTVTAGNAPTVTVTAPTGTQDTTRPTVMWSYSDPENDPQASYRVRVFSLAQYSVDGFDPATSPASWDSTEVTSSAARSVIIGTDLANLLTYRAYVRVAQAGPQFSPWAFSAFTLNLNPPAVPSVTSSYDATLNRVAINIQGNDNMLPSELANGTEGGSVTGLFSLTNATVASSTAFAHTGTRSIAATATANGSIRVSDSGSGTSRIRVTPGAQYTLECQVRAATVARNHSVRGVWFKADGSASVTASTQGSAIAVTTAGFTRVFAVLTAPADAALARFDILSDAGTLAGEVFYYDTSKWIPGNAGSIPWTRGGLTGITMASVEYSDDNGVTWAPVRNGMVPIPAESQQVTVVDNEAPLSLTRRYRVKTTAVV